ncbi:non-ribosomal peptide synthetase [Allonocardiopsis opalescens]|uniref:Amino acid adenylation domain-containing protein n=1 Tax=Allonocardiopsis opalescens TaxID=1144618 RepID=A0A2T0PYC6_9ACTN|nr:amino acid adenylation domain-containing protein [Allonocardiopsis opalescens]PRX96524.1 amino acid adenylation domain-containing protein [Allonocardiopsis opalescens]
MTTELLAHTGPRRADHDETCRTRLPDWLPAAEPPGSGRHTAEVPAGLARAVRELAAREGTSTDAVLLAAHTKVLSVLTGEPWIAVGVAEGAVRRGVAVEVPGGSWSELVRTASAALEAAGAGAEAPAADYDTLLDRGPDPAGDAQAGLVLHVDLGECPRISVGYPPERFSADYAARVAGYHLTALKAMTAEPEAPHADTALPDADETEALVRAQERNFAELPDVRAHELVAEQARRTPDRPALTFQGTTWSYAELDACANRIAHRLLADGPLRETVVAVLTERTLEWAAALLAVLRAGGVYLPVDPAYPPERIGTLLTQSGCRSVLAAEGHDEHLADALAAGHAPAVRVIPLSAAAHTAGPDTDPGVRVEAGQAAYIYFTSGSTGTPKGAVCEHLGMSNHLRAKIHDLELSAADTVVQSAPLCFDISLWQLMVPLTTGGRAVIVSDAEILDVGTFLDRIRAERATVVQLVPSYLDIVLAELEARPRPLPALRCVSVTGEAVGKPLVQRWLARYPDVFLVNAYGATEASDDTTHAVIRSVPPQRLVPVGRPVTNAAVYVVDERLRMVPPGAPGEVVFSGPCVGRGYVNDPERTGRAFIDDPFRPGRRAYRTGDFGRWLPDGELEFLGRRDEQIKIRGMRVEIGEVENHILDVAGVRTVAVVARKAAGGTRLAAFFTGEPTAAELTTALRATLPAHMVPAGCYRLGELPVTENGKIDKKALAAEAERRGASAAAAAAPGTEAERAMAVLWAELLGYAVEDIGADDDFFALGGDSLAAVRLVMRLDGAVSLADLMREPTLRGLAAAAAGEDTGGAAQLLQSLSRPARPLAVLLCVPDAGGNAVNFQRFARALASGRLAVYGLELPGHDVARADEEPVEPEQAAARAVAELARLLELPLAVWGQGAGAAVAVETARQAHARGRQVSGVFLGGRLPGAQPPAGQVADEVVRMDDDEVKAVLAAGVGFTELDDLRSERSRVVAAAYRHDVVSDARYFERWGGGRAGLPDGIPVVAVLPAGHPASGEAAPGVAVEELSDREGGRPGDLSPERAAEVVLRHLSGRLDQAPAGAAG